MTDIDTAGSTGLRVEGGADATGTGLTLNVSGNNAFGVVASGASRQTTFDAMGASITVSGNAATGVRIEGGATGLIGAASTITLAGPNTTAAIVDGQAFGLDGTATGAPDGSTSLASSAVLTSNYATLTGYVAQNGGQLQHSGTIAFAGANDTGIRIIGAGSSATHTGSIVLSGSGTGVAVLGGRLVNAGTIAVANGTGILLDGTGSTLTGSGPSPVTAGDGVAALRITNGASVDTVGSFTGGGTAHAVLVDAGAGAVTLGGGTLTVTGSGNALENAADSTAIRLDGTAIQVAGPGSGIRTAVALDPASTATITVAGTNGTGFTFAGAGGAATTGNLTLGTGYAITAGGPGATGVRVATTGTATLATTVTVTGAQGGSALVAGPAALVTNTGTLRSASSASVVDLTGNTTAFATSGTIAAASPNATAIAGGNNGQAITVSGGAVTGVVALGTGADTFVMTGGVLTGALATGAGNDTATFRGLTDANLTGATSIAGNGTVGGNDVLTFQGSTTTGTTRLTGWNAITLTGSTLTSDGNLTLAGGTFTIDRDSTFRAGAGSNTVIAATAGGTATLVNAGRIDLTNGGSGATDQLVVRGNYVGQSGTLALQSVLGTDGSPSDQLIIDGGTASGTTTIQVSNLGGLGAATSGNGIQLVGAINGGTTTATTSKSAFTLAGGQINAGAFEYRLYASDIAGTGQGWYLRTAAATPGSPATDQPASPNTTYRVEAPLLAALPGQLRQGDLDFLGTYHRRMGDAVDETGPAGFTIPGRLWGRYLLDDYHYRQGGDVSPRVDGRTQGFQLGIDLFQYGDGSGRHDVGVYGGHTEGDATVSGFASGIRNLYVGRIRPTTTYAGVYWTYVSRRFYVDTVVQRSWYGGRAQAIDATRADVGGTGALASVETGYAVPLSSHWSLEPQLQLVGQGVSLDPVAIPAASVVQDSDGYLTGRVGLRLKGDYAGAEGSVQPYLRANLWKGFASTDRTIFVTPAASTVIDTRNASLWGEAGGGLTWSPASRLALYGEVTHRFALDNDQGVVGQSTGGSVGAKLRF